MIDKERVKRLNSKKIQSGDYVVYWMQQSQRIEFNHALEYAIEYANKIDKPLIVFFGLTDDFPEGNIRHYTFMIQGLKEVQKDLQRRGIKFVIQHISPEKGIINISKDSSLIVTDRGYLRIQRQWRKNVSNNIKSPLFQVESDVVIPVETVSEKEEYSAATIRSKISKKLDDFLKPLKKNKIKNHSLDMDLSSINLKEVDKTLKTLDIDKNVKPVSSFIGGNSQAKKLLKTFIRDKLEEYSENKNDPAENCVSHMSPYLHFGQISPGYIALEIKKSKSSNVDAYLEELIVRRELSMNFVFYNNFYDAFKGIPDWAKKTLKSHEKDKREYNYSLDDLEKANTHDKYWNAAQKEMINNGKMHGYMRMYWGKKIIEWSEKPETAFKNALYLNNKYELDGRDANSFTGISWCFGKHDRPWKERKIFGKIRYMNAKGLERKFDIQKYAKKY